MYAAVFFDLASIIEVNFTWINMRLIHASRSKGKWYLIIYSDIPSRHISKKKYRTYVKYIRNVNLSEDIQGWVCECKVGLRTLRCCSHITAYQSKIDDPGSTLLRLLGINVSEDDNENEDYTEYIESFEDFNVIKYLTHSVCKILHRKRFSTATNLLKVGICSPDSKLQNKPSFRLVAIEKRLGQKMNGCVSQQKRRKKKKKKEKKNNLKRTNNSSTM
ncbi:hypothetical protein BpHYR1_024680 [Brachionus plicatilis]|uniref:SWIM-type domain-containing protein n=1 Tax=Brachionus plicatilis TaxID=10195 RepID=A0A3M7SCZ7_BRAPC|nr:hypothetical protein BpHYR1_024680 [Brachionus plicatilis]